MSYSDRDFGENAHPEPEDFALPVQAPRRAPASKSLLVAAFSGLMIALGWDEPRERATIVAAADDDAQDWLDLNFGGLEPLGHANGTTSDAS